MRKYILIINVYLAMRRAAKPARVNGFTANYMIADIHSSVLIL